MTFRQLKRFAQNQVVTKIVLERILGIVIEHIDDNDIEKEIKIETAALKALGNLKSVCDNIEISDDEVEDIVIEIINQFYIDCEE